MMTITTTLTTQPATTPATLDEEPSSLVCEFTIWVPIVAETLTVPAVEVILVDEPMDGTVAVVGINEDPFSNNVWLILITVTWYM